MVPKIVASELLLESVERHQIHLSLLVADTGLWVNPEVHQRLLRDTGSIALFPNVRRARIGQREKRGELAGDIRLDDNTYANVAIKRALGVGKSAVGFEACHIWPLTCYDERYHTAVANIVLLPRALAGLSDHDAEIQKALQYRANELYGWWPEEMPQPTKPDFYPSEWREPQPDPALTQEPRASRRSSVSTRAAGEMTEDERDEIAYRIRRWADKPDANVHQIIALVVRSGDGIARDQLVQEASAATGSRNAYGAVASLMTSNANAYGRVLVDTGGIVRLHPEVEALVRSLRWGVA